MISCSKKETEIPPGVLSRKEMVRVLIDVHLLEAKVKKLYLSKDSSQAVYDHYEKMLFDDLGITQEQYEQSTEFYVDHIDDYKPIYDQVVDSLLARQKSNKAD